MGRRQRPLVNRAIRDTVRTRAIKNKLLQFDRSFFAALHKKDIAMQQTGLILEAMLQCNKSAGESCDAWHRGSKGSTNKRSVIFYLLSYFWRNSHADR